jgi:undecaprenyl-diphosphatase
LDVLNSIISYDKQLLLFLHSKGSLDWDSFWILITNPVFWIPFFLVLFYLGFKSYGIKQTLLTTIITIIGGLSSLLVVHFIKNYFQRIRPLNDISINNSMRLIVEQNDFSFVSGHSTLSFTISFILYWILKKDYKYSFLLFIFPVFFSYSRIYLGVHFPADIIVGMLLGYIIAIVFFKLIKVTATKI